MNDIDRQQMAGIVPGLISVAQLPATRLELRWEPVPKDEDGYTLFCHYELVLQLMPYDIRGEEYKDDELVKRHREKRLTLGGTRTDGNETVIDWVHRTIRTPFRDHSHIRQDALRLGIPAYVVAEGVAMQLLPAVPRPEDNEYPQEDT